MCFDHRPPSPLRWPAGGLVGEMLHRLSLEVEEDLEDKGVPSETMTGTEILPINGDRQQSGGDNAEGDRLKDEDVQEQYWKLVSERIESHWKEFPSRSDKSNSQAERESNILLFLRKLREGILSSHRKDRFALDVYETSFYLAIIFNSPVQAASSLAHLPDIISALPSNPRGSREFDQNRAEALVVTSSIFRLTETFPSQMMFHRQMKFLKSLCCVEDKNNVALEWISSIRISINCRNYTKFATLTCEERVKTIIRDIRYLAAIKESDDAKRQQYARIALFSAVDELRRRLRSTVWTILRSAYREYALSSDTDTASWLERSLFLKSGDKDIDVEDWLEQCEKDGHVVKKEGFQGRWIIRR
ncbi:hypothetical protein ACEPAH_8712 [Sanghuangporus vaninii]